MLIDNRKKPSVSKENKHIAETGTLLKGPHGPVPYIASWSGEIVPSPVVVDSPLGGIGYSDETLLDRDRFGVLWARVLSRRGDGEPLYAKQNSLRQRKSMRLLLCQVCGAPADRNEHGVLWLLHDHRGDWPRWPEGMANSHPPLCLRCAKMSVKWCPSFGSGFMAVRAHSTVVGVYGAVYGRGPIAPRKSGVVTLRYDSYVRQWVQAWLLLRELRDCTFVEL